MMKWAILTLLCHMPAMAQENTPAPDMSDMVLIPAGVFVMGSNRIETEAVTGEFGNRKPWYLDEHPQHRENLPDYYLEEHEVTNRQFLHYVAAADIDAPQYWFKTGYILTLQKEKLQQVAVEKLRKLAADVFRIDKDTRAMSAGELLQDIDERLRYMDDLPVTNVSWQQARGYCQWAGFRLPTEAEWEKAARTTKGQEFPWGDEWREHVSNTGEEQWPLHVAPVKSYPADKSPYGIYDLAGNVTEWVADWYQPYPGSDYQSQDFGQTFKVARGASWGGGEGHYYLHQFQRGAYRNNLPPDYAFDDVGFRCAADKPVHAQAARAAAD